MQTQISETKELLVLRVIYLNLSLSVCFPDTDPSLLKFV